MTDATHPASTTPDTLELRRKAEAAYRDYGLADIAVGGGERAARTVPEFIQAASPSVVIALLDRLDALEGRAQELAELLGDLEFAAILLAKGRPQAAYDAMIAAGQPDALIAFDHARLAARKALPEAPTTLADEGRDQ